MNVNMVIRVIIAVVCSGVIFCLTAVVLPEAAFFDFFDTPAFLFIHFCITCSIHI